MSDLVEDWQDKARRWNAESERAPEYWRPMYAMLAREYERLARERLRAKSTSKDTGVTG